jgi:hypothetical protein
MIWPNLVEGDYTMNETYAIPDQIKNHPAWIRLENQQKWYSNNSSLNKKWFMAFKVIQIVLAAFIPVVALIEIPNAKFISAISGALIVILEAIQQLFQFSSLWVEYRSTTENLKHEKYLFLALSGPYRNLTQEDALFTLAARVEEHVSKEHAKWIDTSKKAISEKRS